MQHWNGSRIISYVQLSGGLVPGQSCDLVTLVLTRGLQQRGAHIRAAACVPAVAHTHSALGGSERHLFVVRWDLYVGYGALLEIKKIDLDILCFLLICDSRSNDFKKKNWTTLIPVTDFESMRCLPSIFPWIIKELVLEWLLLTKRSGIKENLGLAQDSKWMFYSPCWNHWRQLT